MLNKVLVPLDGSPLATCVIPHLVAITRATDAQITLLRVTEMSNDQSGRINPVEWHLSKVEAQTYLDEIAERLGQFTDQKPDTQVLQGPAAERIIEYAQKHSYDLIVLSTHGQSGLNGWNVSSVAMKVINRAGLSILLVPAYRPDMGLEGNWGAVHYEHILAPLDGSQRAECVLPIAASLTQQYQAELLLAHVVVRPEMIQRMPLTSEDTTLADQVVERNQIQATKYFEQLQNRLSPAPRTRIIVSDHLTSELHKLLEQEEIDLVLVSAHGNSGQNQWPYGSVVTSFITHSAVPLLILQDLPLYEIQPTEAERATSVKQQVLRKSNGHNENYCEREQNGQASGQAGQSLQSVFTNIKKNYGIRETPKVRAYAYTALL
ncbi:MAG: universal stress protein [Chloroflexi bacterium]|nr:universal stress protein [Chloroflexota bacterium]